MRRIMTPSLPFQKKIGDKENEERRLEIARMG